MKLFKPSKPKPNIALALYLESFNTQSMAVRVATRAWAARKLLPKLHPSQPQ